MITCNVCNGESPNDAKFCIDCGIPLAYTEKTKRLNTDQTLQAAYKVQNRRDSPDYFYIYRRDLHALLKQANTFIPPDGTIYYNGREVILLD